ncbi:MAG: 2-oxoglutarate and iron-dependent oxygenase domain-containing protein [Polyangiaceae bacterium]
MTELSIPSVDLQDPASGNQERVARAGEALRTAFGRYGLVYVFGHSVDAQKLRALYGAFREFVAWPEEKKKPYGRADLWFQRGWTPPNTEVAVAGGGQPDFKECYSRRRTPPIPSSRRITPSSIRTTSSRPTSRPASATVFSASGARSTKRVSRSSKGAPSRSASRPRPSRTFAIAART